MSRKAFGVITPILAIIVIAIILIVVGFFIYRAVAWRTYTHAQPGFSIKYPPTWTYQENIFPGFEDSSKGIVNFQGPEGTLRITWGGGFGTGDCSWSTIEFQTGAGPITVCQQSIYDHGYGLNFFFFGQNDESSSTLRSSGIDFDFEGSMNAPLPQVNEKTLAKILSTFTFIPSRPIAVATTSVATPSAITDRNGFVRVSDVRIDRIDASVQPVFVYSGPYEIRVDENTRIGLSREGNRDFDYDLPASISDFTVGDHIDVYGDWEHDAQHKQSPFIRAFAVSNLNAPRPLYLQISGLEVLSQAAAITPTMFIAARSSSTTCYGFASRTARWGFKTDCPSSYIVANDPTNAVKDIADFPPNHIYRIQLLPSTRMGSQPFGHHIVNVFGKYDSQTNTLTADILREF